MQRVRSTRVLLETCEAESAAASSRVTERCSALDAAKLALVVAEGDLDALSSPDSSGTFIHCSTLWELLSRTFTPDSIISWQSGCDCTHDNVIQQLPE